MTDICKSIAFNADDRARLDVDKLAAEIARDLKLWQTSGDLPVSAIKAVVFVGVDVSEARVIDEAVVSDHYFLNDITPGRGTPRAMALDEGGA